MLRFRICWQLLLGWALLLGQPVFGDSGSSSSEEHSLPVPEKPVPVSEEPEKPVAEEPEKPVPEEPEKLLPELEEPEELLPELEEPEQLVPVQEEPAEKKPPSEEELEEMEKEERAWLKHEKQKPCGSWLQYLQAIALGHYNKKRNEYYKLQGDVTLRTKKAIGTMANFKMVLVKTNCTNDMHHHRFPFDMYDYYESPPLCEPLQGSEKECTYTLFSDGRKPYFSMSVISEKCKPMRRDTKGPASTSYRDGQLLWRGAK